MGHETMSNQLHKATSINMLTLFTEIMLPELWYIAKGVTLNLDVIFYELERAVILIQEFQPIDCTNLTNYTSKATLIKAPYPAGTRLLQQLWVLVVFCSQRRITLSQRRYKVVFPTSFLGPKPNVRTTLSFRRQLSHLILTLQQRCEIL